MNTERRFLIFLGTLVVCAMVWCGGRARAQVAFGGTAGNFNMNEYYLPPHETQMKTSISGVEAQPQPGARYLIKGLHLETYRENGEREAIVESPECVYDAAKRMASSSGHIRAISGDGKFLMEGDGFLWQQDAGSLIISNQVRTVISGGAQPFNR